MKKIERQGPLSSNYVNAAGAIPRPSPSAHHHKVGRYAAQFEMRVGVDGWIALTLNDLSAEEMALLVERYHEGKPLKVTIE